ncbi:DNA-binding Lrp family transcriptional regulator [Rhodococcus sp. 27YEA15]|uniref:Lrp/AsnC family transcriptional regulator n=1 Tax=Rhodococcus sp. 27YEA15 TaxID=3156259 RepID=UPI003C79A8B3
MSISSMHPDYVEKTAIVDAVDMQLIQALSIHRRASFALLAAVLGLSEQTVARRYRRLQSEGILRIVAVVDTGDALQTNWTLRLRCSAQVVEQVSATLARRTDVSWVSIAAGGSEIVCNVHCRTLQERESLLLNKLPKTRFVDHVDASEWIHEFKKDEGADWQAYGDYLSLDQCAVLEAEIVGRASSTAASALTAEDMPMLSLLAVDGRTSVARLARATGHTYGRTSRRLDALATSGTVAFDIDIAYELLGYRSTSYLWLTVHPNHLAEAGQFLAGQREVPFVVAITGRYSLAAAVICRTAADLYDFVTTKVRILQGLSKLEVSPIIRTVKQAGALRDGLRLAPPAPAVG